MSRGVGNTQKKILLLLYGGIGLSLARTPHAYAKVISSVSNEWKKLNRDSLRRSIKSLYESKMVNWKENKDGSISLKLTEKGKDKILTYNIDSLKIDRPKRWDGKWRVITFDIPESYRKARDALRRHLKQIGFYELQKSVFIHPYPCGDVINFLIEFYNIRKNVRQILAEDLDNSLDLKDHFGLL